jgi:hypothetical protein
MSLEQAQARPEDLQSLNIAVPADPRHTAEERNTTMGASIPSPKSLPGFSNGTKPQTGEIIFLFIYGLFNDAACSSDGCKTGSLTL